MSCSSPPPPLEHDDDGRTRAPALDLLDEYWFFSNTLVTNNSAKKKTPPPPPPHLPRSPSSASASGNQQPQEKQRQQAAAYEVDDDDLNWSSIYEGVLRTRMAEGGGARSSGLRRAPSMPVPSSATDGDGRRQTKSTPSMPRPLLRHSHSTLGRHTPPTKQRTVARCSTKQLQDDKKWKSSSDLESMEVQGFRDLGFVFDKEELRESLADVLPGLKQQTKSTSPRRRPYLSEAWHQVRRPALARVQSAAEMKDQLRMWAQAVACNVRQEG